MNRIFTKAMYYMAIIVLTFAAVGKVSAQASEPFIRVSTSNGYLQADKFTPNAMVTFTVYASQSSSDVILEITRQADDSGFVFIDGWEHGVDLAADNYVVATDDMGIEKQLLLEPLTMEVFNPVTNFMAGTALPGRSVWVLAGNDVVGYPVGMWVNTDSEGIWKGYTDDFSEDMWGGAVIYDEDGDFTVYHLGPTSPAFIAVSLTQNWFMANGFVPEKLITFYTYENQSDPNPVLEFSRKADAFGNVSIEGWEHLWDLELDNFVVATDGFNTKELLLEYITLDVFDPENDFISGHALPGREVSVGVGNETGEQWLNVFANETTGEWNADFTETGFNITEDMWAGGHVGDEDGDVTAAHNSGPPEPPAWFTAFPKQDFVEGWNWPLNANIHLMIDDPATTEISPDYEQYETLTFAPWGSGELWVWFEFGSEYDLKPGDVVTLTDGTTERTHVVRNLSITEIAHNQNTVTGTSDANETIYLWSWEDPQGLRVQTAANNAGVWKADFDDVSFDLLPGFHVRAEIWDENGNDTAVDWYAHPIYTGLWRAIDSYDQSNMQMTISGGGNNQYKLTWTDDYWSGCKGRSIGHGIGILDPGGSLWVDWVIECKGAVVWEGQANYFMDIATSTLSDGTNTWYLVGNK